MKALVLGIFLVLVSNRYVMINEDMSDLFLVLSFISIVWGLLPKNFLNDFFMKSRRF